MAASPRELEEIRRRGLEGEAAKFEQFGLPPSMALRQTFDEYQQARVARGQNVAQPNTRAFMEAAAASGNPITVREALDLQSGVMGSNVDTRDWYSILNSANPVAAAREATRQYYERGAVERPFDPAQEARNLEADYRSAVDTRTRQIENMLGGKMADPAGSRAYGVSPEQLEEYRRAQASGGSQGIASLLQSQRFGGLAPSIAEMFRERTADIQRGGPEPLAPVTQRFGPLGFFEDTGRAALLDPRGNILTTMGGRNRDLSPRALSRLTSYGINPYTLQPMYQGSLTPAFDALSLGYDFGDLDPYSPEGITSYLSNLAPGTPGIGPEITQAYYGDLASRTGLQEQPMGGYMAPGYGFTTMQAA